MSSAGGAVTVRAARQEDAALIHSLIRELAEYEKLLHEAGATVEEVEAALFGPHPGAEVVIAECDGEVAGYALFFHNFSTFQARRGLYLEDLFVRPAFRGRGIGKRLLLHLARVAVERDCGRFEWAVLDWNTPSIEFYQHLGARPMKDWTVFRVDGDALRALADQGMSS